MSVGTELAPHSAVLHELSASHLSSSSLENRHRLTVYTKDTHRLVVVTRLYATSFYHEKIGTMFKSYKYSATRVPQSARTWHTEVSKYLMNE